jgi:hypothetical protein
MILGMGILLGNTRLIISGIDSGDFFDFIARCCVYAVTGLQGCKQSNAARLVSCFFYTFQTNNVWEGARS